MINTILYPDKSAWENMCARPSSQNNSVHVIVSEIIERIKNEGDKALYHYTELFDKITLSSLKVSAAEISDSENKVSDELKKAIATAKSNIEKYHSQQVEECVPIETSNGVKCWRNLV